MPTTPLTKFLGTVALCVLLIEWMFGFFLLDGPVHNTFQRFYRANHVPTLGESIVYWKYNFLLGSGKAKSYRIVALGDASCLMGVVPEVIEARTGRKTLNLGIDGSYGLGLQADMLELYMAKFGTPELVILHLSAPVLDQLSMNKVVIARERLVRGWVASINSETEFDYGFDYAPGLLPRDRQTEWMGSGDAQSAKYFSVKRGIYQSDDEMRNIFLKSDGFLPNPNPPVEPRYTRFEPKFSPGAKPILGRLFRLAGTHRFRILLVVNPISDSHFFPKTKEAFARLETDLKKFAATYPGVSVFPGILRPYPNDLTWGTMILRGEGPVRNSEEIGDWIAANL